jgi:hypothetical protein
MRQKDKERMVRLSPQIRRPLTGRMSAQEIATLRKEAHAFNAVRAALRDREGTDAARQAFQKVLHGIIPIRRL